MTYHFPTQAVILIAEHRENKILMIRKAFRRALMQSQLEVVRDGAEVLAYLDGKGKYSNRADYPLPTLLFLNAKMPGSDAFDVLQSIRNRPPFKKLPVVIMSSSKTAREVSGARQLGPNSVLVKTRTLEELIELTGLVNRSWLRHRLAASPLSEWNGRKQPQPSPLFRRR